MLAGYVVLVPTSNAQALVAFDWTDWKWEGVSINMLVKLSSDGPLAQNNPLHFQLAALYAISVLNFSGQISLSISGDRNFTDGQISFSMAPLISTAQYFYESRSLEVQPSGQITPFVSGRVGLFAHISVTFNGTSNQAWSQYTSSGNFTPETWRPVASASEYYGYLGLKLASASLLVAAAVGFPTAMESLRRLRSKRIE